MLKPGLACTVQVAVNEWNTASYIGSGDLEVFATPAMLAAMENAAMQAVADVLPSGSTTVGASITSSHLKPSCIGAVVAASAVLASVDGAKLTFDVKATDGETLIGEGTHVRYIVDRERFMAKALKK